MSRTDAHAPLWVRLARGELAVEAIHAADHVSCDLPQRPPTKWDGWLPATKCYWSFRHTGTNVCSCSMCHAGPQHRQDNRNQRHHDRTRLATALKHWHGGDEHAFDDDAAPHRNQFW